MQTKLCPCCHKHKDLDKFGKRKIGKVTYLQSHCISCRGVKNPNAKNKKVKKSHTHKKNPNARRASGTDRNRTRGTKPKNRKPRQSLRSELEAKASRLEATIAKLEAQLQ